MVRSTDEKSLWRLKLLNIVDKLHLIKGNITDYKSLERALEISHADEVYNFAAQSSVSLSWKKPVYTSENTGMGVVNILDAAFNTNSEIRFFQASSSEIFGVTNAMTQDENTLFNPRSPYGAAKLFGHYITRNYRDSFGCYSCSGILFNHDSPLRDHEFVTRKISGSVARIVSGKQDKLLLGNIDVKRDWGFAKDYVEAMWLVLQQETPDDYVIATGQSLSVRDICRYAFSYVGLDYEDYVEIDPALFRHADIDELHANPSKISEKIGWQAKTPFKDVIGMMIDNDLRLCSDQSALV